jgi:hypothetical protein
LRRSLRRNRGDTGCGEEHDSCNCTHFDRPAKSGAPPPPASRQVLRLRKAGWLPRLQGDASNSSDTGLPRPLRTRASVLIESEPKLWIPVLARFPYANRYPLRSKTLRNGRLLARLTPCPVRPAPAACRNWRPSRAP